MNQCIILEFNPIRCGFHGSAAPPLMTSDILNTGVRPALLLEFARETFERNGGRAVHSPGVFGFFARGQPFVIPTFSA